jgi:eukaryotic-like serine/threonine-protein kinase
MIGVRSIVGSYRIVRAIGAGGMGMVFEAMHTVMPRRAAIKVLRPELCGLPGMDAQLVHEASILDELHHPGIVQVFDCGLLADGCPWIAMELVAGESLGARIARGPLAPAEACRVVAAVADVLVTVHRHGIVHRDLKPENVLFAEPERGCEVRVIDWGVARLASSPDTRLALDEGTCCGTPIYMSPEQATGHDIAPPCDIYSLGVIAYEALTGQPPFDGTSVAEVLSLHLNRAPAPLSGGCRAAPPELCEMVHHMLEKDPAQRPTATEVRDVMQRLAIQLAGPNPEFESYELIASTATASRLRWTPAPRGPWLTARRTLSRGNRGASSLD